MKKMMVGFFAVLFAAATVFAGTETTKTSFDPLLHWFDENGNYIGQATESTQRQICDEVAGDVCMNGYEEIDSEGNPVGDALTLFKE